jgi:hypothetical protein
MLEIQTVHDRSPFARQWLKSARAQQDNNDVFSAYFSAYIALVACVTQIAGDKSGKLPSGDDEKWERQQVADAFILKSRQIAVFLETNQGMRIKEVIWQREIPEGEKLRIIGPGLDTELTFAAQQLERFFRPGTQVNSVEYGEQSRQLSILFSKVRNRLFHGGKMYDPEGTDAEFLQKINPLLIEIVEILLKH